MLKPERVALKDEEEARKRREKSELLAQEEAVLSGTKVKKAVGSGMAAKQSKSKKKDELSLLEEALVGDAEKKAKEKKRAERLKKEREERMAAEAARKKLAEGESATEGPLLSNTEEMIGGTAQYFDGSGELVVGSRANRAIGVDNAAASGLNAALGQLSVGGPSANDIHPEKRMKALHMAFEERMMPIMKEDFPGLKMSQYKDKVSFFARDRTVDFSFARTCPVLVAFSVLTYFVSFPMIFVLFSRFSICGRRAQKIQ